MDIFLHWLCNLQDGLNNTVSDSRWSCTDGVSTANADCTITYTFDTLFTVSHAIVCKYSPRLVFTWLQQASRVIFVCIQAKNVLSLAKNLDVAEASTALNVLTRGLFCWLRLNDGVRLPRERRGHGNFDSLLRQLLRYIHGAWDAPWGGSAGQSVHNWISIWLY